MKGTGGTSLVSLTPTELARARRGSRAGSSARTTSGRTRWRSRSRSSGSSCVWLIARSRFGRSLIAVRDHEAAADVGRHRPRPHEGARVRAERAVRRHRRVALGARRARTPSADKVETFQISIEFLVAVVIGGTATVIGPLIGGFVVVYIQTSGRTDACSRASRVVSPAIFGIVLIVLMYVLPDGIVGGGRRLRASAGRTLRSRRRAPSTPRPLST